MATENIELVHSKLRYILFGGNRIRPAHDIWSVMMETMRASQENRRVPLREEVEKFAKVTAVLGLSAAKFGNGLSMLAEISYASTALLAPFIYSQFGHPVEPIPANYSAIASSAFSHSLALAGAHYLQTLLHR